MNSIENLTFFSVFIRILYNENLLNQIEIIKFRYFLQDFNFIEPIPQKQEFFISLMPIALDSIPLIKRVVSIEESVDFEHNNNNEKKPISDKKPPIKNPSIEENINRFSPPKFKKMKSLSKKKILKKSEKIPEFEEFFPEDVVLLENNSNNYHESYSNSSSKHKHKKSQILKPMNSFLRLISPTSRSIHKDMSFNCGKNELCYSNYTLESADKSPTAKEETESYKRSFVKEEKLLLVRQHSL